MEDKKRSKNVLTYVLSEDTEDNLIRKSFNKKFKKNKFSKQEENKEKIINNVDIPELISVSDLSDRMAEKKGALIKKLFTMGIIATANQIIDADTAELLVIEFGHKAVRVADSDVEIILDNETKRDNSIGIARAPVVTVMGHVDHGKTSLLDALRTTNIVSSESGGITQHIGASRIETKDGKFITFIDTPGHEAFTEMRMRGANITDIVVLVVAADDGVKDQTIEAINHAKAAKVPMIIAINKIDKPAANPEVVKQELLKYDVVVEDFGGEIMAIPVSAKSREGLDKLMEAILLQAEVLELKAPIDCNMKGAVVEARMDLQKGPIVSILVQQGVLKVGDLILAGTAYGKIKRMVDDKKKREDEAFPSMAVEVLGFNSVPNAGDKVNFITSEKEARDIVSYRERKEKDRVNARNGKSNLENLFQNAVDSSKKTLSVVVKSDVSGSAEAIIASILKLSDENININVIHSATGIINESDVNLATISNALVIGFNVRSTIKAKDIAKEKGIEIRYYSIIYNILDDIKTLMNGLMDPVKKEEILGQAEVRSVMKVTGVGKIAGCYVTDGEIQRNAFVRVIRDGVVIYDGKIKSLKRFKEDVKEVKNNYECGINIENFDDIKDKDVLECYKVLVQKEDFYK